MHVLTLIVAGLVLLSLVYGVARSTGRRFRNLLPYYLAVWFVASLANLWIGVTRAGYSVAEEALVLIPVFGIPALAAFLLARRAL